MAAAAADYAETLRRNGAVVLPVDLDSAAVRAGLAEAAAQAPEFLDSDAKRVIGFPAYSFPSAPHAAWPARAREGVLAAAAKHLKGLIGSRAIEAVVDRWWVDEQSGAAESFHRDMPLMKLPGSPWGCVEGDTMLQGIYACGGGEQVFSYVPGSHLRPVVSAPDGFVRGNKAEQKKAKAESVVLPIPDGHVLLFNPKVLHEVRKQAGPTSRVFTPLRFTHSKQSFAPPEALKAFFDPEVRGEYLMPSGQRWPMYATLHWVNHTKKLVDFADGLVPGMLTVRRKKTGPHAGKGTRVPHRYSESMKQRGLPTDGPTLAKWTDHARKFCTPSTGPWTCADGRIIPALE